MVPGIWGFSPKGIKVLRTVIKTKLFFSFTQKNINKGLEYGEKKKNRPDTEVGITQHSLLRPGIKLAINLSIVVFCLTEILF